jgi:hypothetical protein
MTTCSDSVENPIVTARGKTDSGATTTRSRIGENHYGTQFRAEPVEMPSLRRNQCCRLRG